VLGDIAVDANNSPTQFYKVVTADSKAIHHHVYEREKYRVPHVTQYGVSTARSQR